MLEELQKLQTSREQLNEADEKDITPRCGGPKYGEAYAGWGDSEFEEAHSKHYAQSEAHYERTMGRKSNIAKIDEKREELVSLLSENMECNEEDFLQYFREHPIVTRALLYEIGLKKNLNMSPQSPVVFIPRGMTEFFKLLDIKAIDFLEDYMSDPTNPQYYRTAAGRCYCSIKQIPSFNVTELNKRLK